MPHPVYNNVHYVSKFHDLRTFHITWFCGKTTVRSFCSLVLFARSVRSFAHVHLHDRSTRIRRLMLYLGISIRSGQGEDRRVLSPVAVSSQLVGTQPRSHEHMWFVSGPAGGPATQGQQTKQNINLKGNSTENVEVTQNGSTARGQQNRHIIKKGNRIEADLSATQPHHNSSTVLVSILLSTLFGQIRQIVSMLREVLSFIH